MLADPLIVGRRMKDKFETAYTFVRKNTIKILTNAQ